MGLRDAITALFRRDQKPTTTDEKPNARGAMSPSTRPSPMSLFETENGRTGLVETARKMYDEDGRYKGICSTLARDAVKGGFQLSVKNPQAAEIAEKLRDRLKLDKRLDDWVRLALRDGDSFIESGVTADREIAEVTRKPTLQIRRNSDKFDRFADPVHAYWVAEHSFQIAPTPQTVWLAEWQIIHARWDHDEGSRYGRPLMASGRKAWKKVVDGEINLAVRRKVRAGIRHVHIVEGDGAALEAYKALNKPALDDPIAAAYADFFMNKGDIKVIEGDGQIGDIEDILHHLDTWWVESPVPKSLIGYGKDLNRDVIDEQKQQYDETLGQVREWVAAELVMPLLELQWLLAGILPETLDAEITWPVKKIVTPRDILEAVQAAQLLRAMNVTDDIIAHVLAMFIPGIDAKTLMAAFSQAQDDAGRMARIAADLAKAMSKSSNGQQPDEQQEN